MTLTIRAAVHAGTYHVCFLAGQSNMGGGGHGRPRADADLIPGYREPVPGVRIFLGRELSFTRRMRELRPDENVAIIKYAKGGSSIDDRVVDWGTRDPHDTRSEETNRGANQYDHALSTIRNAMRAARAEVELDDPFDGLVISTDAYGYSDFAHDDAAGYQDLGEKFAEAMDGLREFN